MTWRPTRNAILMLGALVIVGHEIAGAADFRERSRGGYGLDSPGDAGIAEGSLPPRYFPREDGDSAPPRLPRVLARRDAACVPRRVPIPTDAADDPSYVGSAYGLGKPSYYGLTPGFGVDDPFGRPLRPYCR